MEQSRDHPGSSAPSYTNQNAQHHLYQGMPMAPYPQYQGMAMAPYSQYQGMPGAQYGAVQQGYPLSPQVQESGNPCKCCCTVATAAKTLSVLNLLYLLVEIIDIAASWNAKSFGYTFQDMGGFYSCWRRYGDIDYIYTNLVTALILFVVSKLAYFVATIGFLIDTFRSSETKIGLLWPNLFLWISFAYAVFFFTTRILLVFNPCQGQYWWDSWIKWSITTILILVLSIYNGLVARGFTIMVKRRNLELAKMPQDIVEEVPATSTMPVAESTRTETDEVPEIEQT